MIECPHGERCPGCTQLGVPYDEQLARKRLRVVEALGRYPGLRSVGVAAAAGAEPTAGYRTRAKWVVGPDGSLGLYGRGGDHQVVDLPGCRVVAPVIARVGEALRRQLSSAGWAAGLGRLRGVDLREVLSASGPRALVTLVVDEHPRPALEPAREAARALVSAAPEVLGVALNLRPAGSPQVLGPTTIPLLGEREVDDRAGLATVRATFGSFVQAHRGQAARAQRAIAERARGPVLELYGGSGSLGLALAARGCEVDSVESFAPASRAAGAAAAAAGLPLRARVGDAVEAVSEARRAGRSYDLVVVNPPRRGLSPGVRRAAAALGPRLIAYMSCEPRTLARDLDHLSRLGYGSPEASPFDMIPQTDEVETLVFLERRPAPAPRVLAEAAGAVFIDKAGNESVTRSEAGAPSLLARVRALPGLEQATPVGSPGDDVSGVVVFARTPGDAAAWAEAVSAGQHGLLALARGITSPRGSIALGGGRRARYRRRQVVVGHSLLEIEAGPERREQIRAQLARMGHPVLGDERHGHAASNRYFHEKYWLDRPFLHTLSLTLSAPGTMGEITITSPLPADLPLPEEP